MQSTIIAASQVQNSQQLSTATSNKEIRGGEVVQLNQAISIASSKKNNEN